MRRFTAKRGRIAITLRLLHMGSDAQVLISGGRAHLGAVALAFPSADGARLREQSIRLSGHREDNLAARAARRMAAVLGCAVCVSAGIYYEHITREEIALAENLAADLTERCLAVLANRDVRPPPQG